MDLLHGIETWLILRGSLAGRQSGELRGWGQHVQAVAVQAETAVH